MKIVSVLPGREDRYDKIHPIQAYVEAYRFHKVFTRMEKGKGLWPDDLITVGPELLEITKRINYVPLPVVEYNGFYVLADGHHTASNLYIRRQPIVLSIYEDNDEVHNSDRGAFEVWRTIDDFILEFELEWLKEDLMPYNVRYIKDMCLNWRSGRLKDLKLENIKTLRKK